jgi:hypothetical protein
MMITGNPHRIANVKSQPLKNAKRNPEALIANAK